MTTPGTTEDRLAALREACERSDGGHLCTAHGGKLWPTLAHRCNGWIDALSGVTLDADEGPLSPDAFDLPPTPWRFTWSSDSQAGGPGNRTWMLLGADDRYICSIGTTPPGVEAPELVRRLGIGLAALGNATAARAALSSKGAAASEGGTER